MGEKTFTVSKKIVRQGHTLAVNITNECKLYGLDSGSIITVTIAIQEDNADEDND